MTYKGWKKAKMELEPKGVYSDNGEFLPKIDRKDLVEVDVSEIELFDYLMGRGKLKRKEDMVTTDKSLGARVFGFLYPKKSRELYKLRVKMDAVQKSGRIIEIQPYVLIKGLEKLSKPLYLTGDRLLIENNKMVMEGEADYLLGLMATDNTTVSNCVFEDRGAKK